jgi:hypothetical protein
MSINKETAQTIRVLVFPCGAQNALELHDALSQCVNIEVWGASSREDHGRHVFRNYVGGIPYIQTPEFLPAFNEMLRRNRIDALFPTHDTVAEYFANHRNETACRVIMADDEAARICREKRRIYQLFGDCPFTPRTYGTLADVDSYPVFLKPNIGEGGKNTRCVATHEQAAHALALQPDLLIVENLPGEELTVDCFTDRHGVLRFVGPRVRSRVFYGISVNSKTVPLTDEIRAIADEINLRLRFRGLWFFQVKQAGNGQFKLLEVCVRTAGTMCLYRQRGVNLPLLSVYDAMDMDVEILTNDFPVEVDRALFNRFQLGIDYDTIYLDFDDTLICRSEVNRYVLLLLYQAARQGKSVHLLTRHDGDIHQALAQAKIHPGLFKSIQKLDWQKEKFQLMRSGEKAIFIDNAFAERKKVKSQTGMPVFDVDAVPSLLDWRT